MKIKNKVYISTTSSISCAGNNNEKLFENICNGNSGLKQDKNYYYDSCPAIGKIYSKNTFNQNLILKCKEVLDNSQLKDFKDTLLIVGSSVGGMKTTEKALFETNSYKYVNAQQHNIDAITSLIKEEFTFYDDISFSTACTSSANAIGYAYEVLSKGIYKNALVVGVDSLCKTTVGGFLSLGVLSSNPCTPFDNKRDGMNVSEGIACLLLETVSNPSSVELCGVGYSSDAFHMTQPHPDGAMSAMINAIESSHIQSSQINYINAHGTGTIANDTSEANAISAVFGNLPYVSSTKSITGHTLGAAGAIEAIVSCMVIQNQTIPKSSFLEDPENKDVNFSVETIKTNVEYVLSNSFAFGGNNCSLIFGKVI